MPRRKRKELDRIADSIEKLLVLELWQRGVPQGEIAKTVARQKSWVTSIVKGIPKGGYSNAAKAQVTKAKKRTKGS
jgi:hypothetical protein